MSDEDTKLSRVVKGIGAAVNETMATEMDTPVGFALIAFTHSNGSYVSNVEREVIVKKLKELLKIWEKEEATQEVS